MADYATKYRTRSGATNGEGVILPPPNQVACVMVLFTNIYNINYYILYYINCNYVTPYPNLFSVCATEYTYDILMVAEKSFEEIDVSSKDKSLKKIV